MLKSLLKQYYGFASFLPGQEEIINDILEKKNVIGVMPTGGGKSLCFQLPALMMDGVTIVISPLIALMKDQVDKLQKNNIPATFINSSIVPNEIQRRLELVKNGDTKLLYIAPERFYSREFTEQLKTIKVSLFAIDEAHCISEWGHDFRPSYLWLKNAIKMLGNPPVLALTATATKEVRDDIQKQLELDAPSIYVTGFDRPNLKYHVKKCSDSEKMEHILDFTKKNLGTGIIYMGTRKKVDNMANFLEDYGIQAYGYHAGMDNQIRKQIQEDFMNEKKKIIVATNAFGLGIDKSNIRFVIHFDIPGTVESYYQESGRAGRDGLPADCLLFYNFQDRFLREFFLKGENPNQKIIIEIYSILKSQINDPILFTYKEITEQLSESVPEMTVSTVLKIFEKHGIIERPQERKITAYLKFIKPEREVQEIISGRSKIQKKLMDYLILKYTGELEQGLNLNIEELLIELDIKRDSVARMMKKLQDERAINYEPPFRGSEVKLLERVSDNELHKIIGFDALQEKKKRSYSKLDMMENFIYHLGCRRKYILDYFGEDHSGNCNNCDNCLRHKKYSHSSEGQPKEYLPSINI
ncbi:RecQ family ATP-dependent DNA helicase, partial [Patescibacteria group bacterium]